MPTFSMLTHAGRLAALEAAQGRRPQDRPNTWNCEVPGHMRSGSLNSQRFGSQTSVFLSTLTLTLIWAS